MARDVSVWADGGAQERVELVVLHVERHLATRLFVHEPRDAADRLPRQPGARFKVSKSIESIESAFTRVLCEIRERD